MAILKVSGVDFIAAEGEYNAGFFRLKTEERKSYGETISVKKVETVEIVAIGKTHEVTFTAKFIDGRILVAATDNNIYEDIKNSVQWNRPE